MEVRNPKPENEPAPCRDTAGVARDLVEQVEQWREPLYHCACAQLRRYEDAQDVVAATLLRACLKVCEVRRPELLGPWLFAILRNEIRQLHRRPEARSIPIPEESGAPDREIERLALSLDLERALKRIPHDQRRAAALYYLGGYSTAEIARALMRPEGTVRRWLHLARAHLAAEMHDYKARGLPMKAALVYTDLEATVVRQVEMHTRRAGFSEMVSLSSLPAVTFVDSPGGGAWRMPEGWSDIRLFVLDEWIAGRSALELVSLLKQLGKSDPPLVFVLASGSLPAHALFAYWCAGTDGLLELPLEGDEMEQCLRKLCQSVG